MGGARMSLFDINPDREEAFLYKAVSSICSDYLYIWDFEKGACAALRQAKTNGKDQCVEFTAELLEELQLSHCLARSVDNGYEGFRLVFQPICDAGTLKVRGAEALLRYTMPDGREISPTEFIPLLEGSRLILPVGLWVLEQAVIACKVWSRQNPDFIMDVNVSFVQMQDSGFVEQIPRMQLEYKGNIFTIFLQAPSVSAPFSGHRRIPVRRL